MEFLDWEQPTHYLRDVFTADPFASDTQQQDPLTRCVRFSLSLHETALIPLDQITEVVEIDPTAIVTVPELPAWVLGIYHWRGEMLWLIDFNQLSGYASVWQMQGQPAAPMMLIMNINHQAIGIAVSQINDMELHPLQTIQPAAPGLCSPSLSPFVLGILPDCGVPVLNLSDLTLSPIWKKHQGVSTDFSS